MNSPDRDQLQPLLGPTPECPPLQELLAAGPAEPHVATCPHCQAELALFAAFDGPPAAAEKPSIAWMESRLNQVDWAHAGEHGVPAPAAPWWSRWLRPRVLAPASMALASVLVLIGVVQMNRRPQPVSDIAISESQPVRSQQVTVISPVGAQQHAPGRLEWKPVPGAAAYRVRLMEVDGTVLWQTQLDQTSTALPGGIVKQLVPGKRILWDVTAIDTKDNNISNSGIQTFTTNLH
jgi:hypothetical protein